MYYSSSLPYADAVLLCLSHTICFLSYIMVKCSTKHSVNNDCGIFLTTLLLFSVKYITNVANWANEERSSTEKLTSELKRTAKRVRNEYF